MIFAGLLQASFVFECRLCLHLLLSLCVFGVENTRCHDQMVHLIVWLQLSCSTPLSASRCVVPAMDAVANREARAFARVPIS